MTAPSKQPITLYSAMNPLAKLKIGVQWLFAGKGLGATNHFESGGFIRSEAGQPGQSQARQRIGDIFALEGNHERTTVRGKELC